MRLKLTCSLSRQCGINSGTDSDKIELISSDLSLKAQPSCSDSLALILTISRPVPSTVAVLLLRI